MNTKRVVLTILFGIVTSAVLWAQAEFRPNDEGFVRHWLLLAPIPLDAGQSGLDGLDKQQVANEAQLKPKEGDKVNVGGKELSWKKYEANEHLVDLNGYLGKETEDSVGYAVTYVVCDQEMTRLKMKTGSDDQAMVYINGKRVLRQPEARPTDKDQDTTAPITLNKGSNVIVFKIINEKIDWSGCLRFVDANDKPVTQLKVRLTP